MYTTRARKLAINVLTAKQYTSVDLINKRLNETVKYTSLFVFQNLLVEPSIRQEPNSFTTLNESSISGVISYSDEHCNVLKSRMKKKQQYEALVQSDWPKANEALNRMRTLRPSVNTTRWWWETFGMTKVLRPAANTQGTINQSLKKSIWLRTTVKMTLSSI